MPICTQCGKSHMLRSNSKYCSDACRYEARYVERFCKNCNKDMKGERKKKFCCAKCRTDYFNSFKRSLSPYITRPCKVCGTPITTKVDKKFCSRDCVKQHAKEQVTAERIRILEIFKQIKFADFEVQEGDDRDIFMKNLSSKKYIDVRVKDAMRTFGMFPRLTYKAVKTSRGNRHLKINVVNTAELIELYYLKIDKFRILPTMAKKGSIESLGRLILKSRSLHVS